MKLKQPIPADVYTFDIDEETLKAMAERAGEELKVRFPVPIPTMAEFRLKYGSRRK